MDIIQTTFTKSVLPGKFCVINKKTPKWEFHKGVIYFSIKRQGHSAAKLERRIKRKGFIADHSARGVLYSSGFKKSNSVGSVNIAVLTGEIFEDSNRSTESICAEAGLRKLVKADVGDACLIRAMFKDEDLEAMGLRSIITMGNPVKSRDGGLFFLGANREGQGGWLSAYSADPGRLWHAEFGFAFEVLSP